MANKCLLPLYSKIYGEKFSYSSFEKRMKMQKAIYLLQICGVPVGDYGFRWYIHGPYSQELQDDMYFEDNCFIDNLVFSSDYLPTIEKVSSLINSDQKNQYTIENWVECLSSIHYLKGNILGFNATPETVIAELEKRKQHLNNHSINLAAYHSLEEIGVV